MKPTFILHYKKIGLLLILLLNLPCLLKADDIITYAGPDTLCTPGVITLDYLDPSGLTFNIYTDDVYSEIVPIGFPFTFYGNTYTQTVLSSNNYISFDLSYGLGYSPWIINNACPSASNPLNAIFAPWHDVDPSVFGTITYSYYGAAPNRVFIYDFCTVAMFSCTDLDFTSQLVLYENGNIIEMHIENKDLCASWNSGASIQGLQNADGTIADIVPGRNYPTLWVADFDGYRFTPTSASTYLIEPIPFNHTDVVTTTIHWYANGVLLDSSNQFVYNATINTEIVLEVTENILNIDCSLTPTGAIRYDTLMIWVDDDVPTTITDNLECSAFLNGSLSTTMAGLNGPWDFTWSNTSTGATLSTSSGTSTSIGGIGVGTYNLQTENTLFCINNYTYNVTSANPNAAFTIAPPPYCEDSPIGFNNTTPPAGMSFNWNFGDGTPTSSLYSPSHTFASAGVYPVRLIYNLGGFCFDTMIQNITIGPVAYPKFAFTPPYICERDTFFFSDSSISTPLSWSWSFDDGSPIDINQNPSHVFANGGLYDVVLSANSGVCGVRTSTRQVEVVDYPYINLGQDTVICEGLSAVLSDGSNNPSFTHLWSDGTTNPTTVITSEQQTVWASLDDRGCRSIDTINVTTNCGIYVPNVFTPDGDNINDIFFAHIVHLKSFSIKVFNRWGERVYYKDSIEHGWDGKYNGEVQPTGAYVYLVTGILENDQVVSKSGNVTLLR